MKSGASFYLAVLVALVFAAIGIYYLVPGVYHPLSADTFYHTTPHLTIAGICWALAALALILGSLARPKPKG